MSLPAAFLARMNRLLGEECQALEDALGAPRAHSLRVNPLKCTPQELEQKKLFALSPVPWCAEGFYYTENDRPGKHPLYEAGVYYIQEPSAMAVGALAAAKPGEWVLDLCAAPGGKTTHLAGQLGGEGVLVANEIHPARAKILAQSIERAGITGALVLNEKPDRLAERFPECFDCVVVDAPCSGEGMFRKDEGAVEEWTEQIPPMCAERQREIMAAAVRMVRPGGRLVYSTCTFAPEENEGTLAWVLQNYPDFHMVKVEGYPWFSPAHPDWVEGAPEEVAYGFRLWPHRINGEGHFCAVLYREDGEAEEPRPAPPKGLAGRALPPEWSDFAADTFTGPVEGVLLRGGDRLWLTPDEMPAADGLKALRTGLELGTVKKGRFEPAHALALSLRAEQVRRVCALPLDDERVLRYLRGETIPTDCENGWTLVTVDGYPLGWGKAVNGTLKNHYPKGLRWN